MSLKRSKSGQLGQHGDNIIVPIETKPNIGWPANLKRPGMVEYQSKPPIIYIGLS